MIERGATGLVVGLGRSGVALATHLHRAGVRVRVCDQRSAGDLEPMIARLPEGCDLRLGGSDDAVLEGCSAVFASPGVPWDSPLLELARGRGLAVSSEIDLFFRECPGDIIGVTGTNGKTTTTAMIGSVLEHAERPVMVGGNIGTTVLDRLPEVTAEHWVVLELSSFQLESVERPAPRVGVILNITPDHLDRHRTLERYIDAKARLIEFQTGSDFAVLNGADPLTAALASRTRAEVRYFDRHTPVPRVSIPGAHNVQNALAAAAVGRIAGLDEAAIESAIASFQGVEHRIELVGEWLGVRWYNDSKATNPDAGRVALAAFPDQDLVLIAGGYGHMDIDGWAEDVRRRARAVVLLGASAPEVEERLAGHPALERAADLEDAVRRAAALARPGGLVLLSPAYKSFDMFQSFEDRGRRFKEAVRMLQSR